MTARRQMVLGAYHTVAGQHGGAWRVSTQATDTESLAQHRAAALTAQDALLHFLLVTDVLGEQGDPVSPGFHPRLEPAVLLAALAARCWASDSVSVACVLTRQAPPCCPATVW